MTDKIILLVEDNPDDEKLTVRALKKHVVHNVVTARDGVEAVDYLFGAGSQSGQYMNPLPALVLLDLKLPKLDGHQVLRRIRAEERTRRLPVVILTSSKEEQDLTEGYNSGVNSYIRKPVDFTQFTQVVAHLGLYWLVLNEKPTL